MKSQKRLAAIIRLFSSHLCTNQFGSLRKQLTSAGLGSLFVTGTNVILGMILVIILSRTLGPEQYGIYTYVFTVVSVLTIPATFGLPNLVIRETAKMQVSEHWAQMWGVWRWSAVVAGFLSFAMLGIGFGVLCNSADQLSYSSFMTWFWGLMLIPIIALNSLRGAALQGLRRVTLGRIPDQVFRPAFLILLTILALQWSGAEKFGPETAMFLQVASVSAAFLIGAMFLHYQKPTQLSSLRMPQYESKTWLSAVIPLAMTAGFIQINKYTDVVMLEYFMSPREVGVYRIAMQGGLMTSFGLQAIGLFISPYFARLHGQRDLQRLQWLATVSARSALLFAAPCFFVLLIWGRQIIMFIFGEQYLDAHIPMAVLAGGQVVNSLFGYVGIILNMTGYQNNVARGVIVTAVLNISLNAVMIPRLGMAGAAVATSITLLVFNLLLWREAAKCLGVNTAAMRSGSLLPTISRVKGKKFDDQIIKAKE